MKSKEPLRPDFTSFHPSYDYSPPSDENATLTAPGENTHANRRFSANPHRRSAVAETLAGTVGFGFAPGAGVSASPALGTADRVKHGGVTSPSRRNVRPSPGQTTHSTPALTARDKEDAAGSASRIGYLTRRERPRCAGQGKGILYARL